MRERGRGRGRGRETETETETQRQTETPIDQPDWGWRDGSAFVALVEDIGSVLNIHTKAHNSQPLVPLSSYRGFNILSWSLWETGTHKVHRKSYRQNTHAYTQRKS